MATLIVIGIISTIAVAPSVLLIPLYFWTQRLARDTAAPRFAVRTANALLALGTLLTLVGLAGALYVVATPVPAEVEGAPSQRARALGEALSEAMNCGVLVVAVAAMLALWLLFGTWRWHWSLRGAK